MDFENSIRENQKNRSGPVKKPIDFSRKRNLVTITKSIFKRFYQFIDQFFFAVLL
jgi:hypothetical protein